MENIRQFLRRTWLKGRRRLVPAIAAVLLVKAASVAAAPPPKPASCPLMITACGCVITHADTYVAVNDLNATASNQNCIEIAAANAILNLAGFNVIGKNDGTGIGILIRKGANRAIVEGGNVKNVTPPANPADDPALAAASFSEVSQWNIGIEDDADDAVIAVFSSVGGLLLLPPTAGNTTGGILLNGVKDSFVGDLNANLNGQYGLMLQKCTDVTVGNISTDRNGKTGFRLDSSKGSSIGPGAAASNGKYGIWMTSSSRNTIHDSNGNMLNGDTGILLDGGSNNNRISNGGAPKNKKKGIVITVGSTDNVVTVTHNEGNGAPNSDMIDLNSNCDHNTWYNNVGTHDPAQDCIQ